MKNKSNYLKYILFAFITNYLIACNSKKEITETSDQSTNTELVELSDGQQKNTIIKTGQLQMKDISKILRLSGKIDVPPQNLVSISAPLGGYLKSTKLLPGMHIRKGEILAALEDQQYVNLQQDYLLARAKLVLAEQEYARQKELNTSQAASDKILQQATNDVVNQNIIIKALAEKLKIINVNPAQLNAEKISKNIFIYSPINGYVSKINVNIGKYLGPTDVLFELIDPSDIHLNLKVFEKDISSLAVGQQLTTYTNSQPDKKIQSEIVLISKDISAEGVLEVHCHFEKYQPTLIPGTFMNAEVQLKNNKVAVLPENSFVIFEGKSYVFIENSANKYEKKEVHTGIKENGMVEITNFQSFSGKKIVIEGAYTLLMALKNKADE